MKKREEFRSNVNDLFIFLQYYRVSYIKYKKILLCIHTLETNNLYCIEVDRI